jgi:hypothetical protein
MITRILTFEKDFIQFKLTCDIYPNRVSMMQASCIISRKTGHMALATFI